MKSLNVNQVYRIANKIFDSKELDKVCPDKNNKDRLRYTLYTLSSPEPGFTTFKDRFGDELNLCDVDGRIYYYVTNLWDYGASKSFPITNEILKAFEVDEEVFGMLKKFGIEC